MPHQGYANINTVAYQADDSGVILGFDLVTGASPNDVLVGPGSVAGVAIAAAVIDVTTGALGDGTHAIVFDGADVVGQLAATALLAGEVKLGEYVEATDAATSVTFEGRGLVLAPTASDPIELTPAS